MVSNLTVGRRKYKDVAEEAQEILDKANDLQLKLTNAIVEDSQAFEELMSTWKNSNLSDEQRELAIEKATYQAANVPINVARMSLEVAQLANKITAIGNANAVTDAAAATLLAQAAVRIASLNVKINAVDLKDRLQSDQWMEELDELELKMGRLVNESVAIASTRGGF